MSNLRLADDIALLATAVRKTKIRMKNVTAKVFIKYAQIGKWLSMGK